jgi:hypothetical protein
MENIPITSDVAKDLNGREVTYTVRDAPNFSNMQPGNAAFGGIGAAAAASSGNAHIRNSNVEDPAIAITDELLRYLSDKYLLRVIESDVAKIKTGSAKKIAKRFKENSDYVLDVQTVNWSCMYRPLNWAKYYVIYSVKLRLIDISSGEKVAEGFYYWTTPKGYDYPSNHQLFRENAKELKYQLGIAKEEAIDLFKSKVLTAPDANPEVTN